MLVADNFHALLILNVADPTRPESVACCAVTSVEDVAVRDPLAFCGSADLVVVSVANPRRPRIVTTVAEVGVDGAPGSG